jgi:hypothetical protein
MLIGDAPDGSLDGNCFVLRLRHTHGYPTRKDLDGKPPLAFCHRGVRIFSKPIAGSCLQSRRSAANSIAKSADSASAFADHASGKNQETLT